MDVNEKESNNQELSLKAKVFACVLFVGFIVFLVGLFVALLYIFATTTSTLVRAGLGFAFAIVIIGAVGYFLDTVHEVED